MINLLCALFEKATLDHLKKKGFVPERIIQFCDNCSGQYKSKGPFQFISEAGIPTIHMYFGAHHGKGPADGAVGWIKSAATRAVKGCQAVIHNAREFFEFYQKKFEHNHYSLERNREFIQEFFFFEEIAQNEEVVAVISQKTRSFYSPTSTGEFCIIEVREVSCCCESCLYGDSTECPNKACVSNWKAIINLPMGKPLVEESFVNKHLSREQHSHDDSNNSNAESNAIQEILAKHTSTEQKKVPSKIKTKLQ